MTNLPATRDNNTAVATNEYAGFASDGTEDIAPSFPIIKIVAGTSQMSGASKHAGEFYRTDTEEFIPTLECVPLFQKTTRAVFEEGSDTPVCRSENGHEPMPYQRLWDLDTLRLGNGQSIDVPTNVQPKSCAICPLGQWGQNDEPPVCRENVVVLVDAGDGELAQLRIAPSSIGVWRRWVARKLKPKKLPLCSQRLTLTTTERSKPGKKWSELVIESEQLSPAEAAAYNAVLQYEAAAFERTVLEQTTTAPANVIDGDALMDDDLDLPFE